MTLDRGYYEARGRFLEEVYGCALGELVPHGLALLAGVTSDWFEEFRWVEIDSKGNPHGFVYPFIGPDDIPSPEEILRIRKTLERLAKAKESLWSWLQNQEESNSNDKE